MNAETIKLFTKFISFKLNKQVKIIPESDGCDIDGYRVDYELLEDSSVRKEFYICPLELSNWMIEEKLLIEKAFENG